MTTDYDEWRTDARERCSPETLPAVLAMIDLSERSDIEGPATVPPCSPWCGLPAGHEYDSTVNVDGRNPRPDEPLTFQRWHQDRPSGGEGLVGSVNQRETYCDGHVVLDEPFIYAFDNKSRELWLGGQEAREIALAWVDLAERFDTVTGQTVAASA